MGPTALPCRPYPCPEGVSAAPHPPGIHCHRGAVYIVVPSPGAPSLTNPPGVPRGSLGAGATGADDASSAMNTRAPAVLVTPVPPPLQRSGTPLEDEGVIYAGPQKDGSPASCPTPCVGGAILSVYWWPGERTVCRRSAFCGPWRSQRGPHLSSSFPQLSSGVCFSFAVDEVLEWFAVKDQTGSRCQPCAQFNFFGTVELLF